ncbi:RHTO0S02e04786g1_1 [Rhodotorula toruloides]|uniref:RHTO0S02e04786g1_1 n=1 Tax=Rhodotorula toruloides TaxID=5286 RepID=A0A061AMR2_RHOTO|nr:RHTO0S02e04786g1_1 [Rhodotorula toruloides]
MTLAGRSLASGVSPPAAARAVAAPRRRLLRRPSLFRLHLALLRLRLALLRLRHAPPRPRHPSRPLPRRRSRQPRTTHHLLLRARCPRRRLPQPRRTRPRRRRTRLRARRAGLPRRRRFRRPARSRRPRPRCRRLQRKSRRPRRSRSQLPARSSQSPRRTTFPLPRRRPAVPVRAGSAADPAAMAAKLTGRAMDARRTFRAAGSGGESRSPGVLRRAGTAARTGRRHPLKSTRARKLTDGRLLPRSSFLPASSAPPDGPRSDGSTNAGRRRRGLATEPAATATTSTTLATAGLRTCPSAGSGSASFMAGSLALLSSSPRRPGRHPHRGIQTSQSGGNLAQLGLSEAISAALDGGTAAIFVARSAGGRCAVLRTLLPSTDTPLGFLAVLLPSQ